MKKHRILIVGQLPPPVHGSNVMTARFLKALRDLGHETDIIEKTFSRNIDELAKINFKKIIKIPYIISKLLLQLIRKKPDICFYRITILLSAFSFDAILIFILRLFKVPYVLYCGANGLRKLKKSYPGILGYIIQKTISGSAGAIVLGERPKDDLLPFLEDRKLFVLPNAVDDHFVGKELSAPAQRELVRILFLANLRESKGPLEFLAMAKEVADRAPQVRFVLGGAKTSKILHEKILTFIKEHNLENKVELPGALYGERKQKYFQDSDIFVFPTKNDVFPSVILEAMQWGLPVISSFEGAIPEVVVDGVTGFIVDPKDTGLLAAKVLELVENVDLRNRFGAAGRKRFEEHYTIETYQKNVKRCIEFFNTLIQKI